MYIRSTYNLYIIYYIIAVVTNVLSDEINASKYVTERSER